MKRREFLFGATAVIGSFFPWLPRRERERLSDAERVRAIFSDPSGADNIGRAYLRSAPEEADPAFLARVLGLDNATDLRRMLAARNKRDFECGDVVLVEGWVLARSEARACAHASLA